MTKNRIPRKLKKGMRTLCKPNRSKWQRRGYLNFTRMIKEVAPLAMKNLIDSEMANFAKAEEHLFSQGGLFVPPPPRIEGADMHTELVLTRPQLDRLKCMCSIVIKPEDLEIIQVPKSAFKLEDIFDKINQKGAIRITKTPDAHQSPQ